MQKQYEEDVDFSHGIHKIAALVFIYPENVINSFADLSIHLDDTFQTMSDYLEDNYIGRFRADDLHTRPSLTIEYWYVYERTKNQQMRTNNSAGPWNRPISKFIKI